MKMDSNELKKREESIEKELKVLRTSYQMYENSKRLTIEKRNEKDENGMKKYTDKSTDDVISLMETMQEDIKQKYTQMGGDVNDLIKNNNENIKLKEDNNQNKSTLEYKKESSYTIFSNSDVINYKENFKRKELYDMIPLPSKGECYPDEFKKPDISVSYLTAYDENLIISPNLYRSGKFIDELLRLKILDNIDPSKLVPGDRDAIILWLRASSYGNEFPVEVTDPETGKVFDTVVDLSKIKYKKLELKGDKNGFFDYTLPISGDKIKFKFLNHEDLVKLDNKEKIRNKSVIKNDLSGLSIRIDDIINSDVTIDEDIKNKMETCKEYISDYINSIKVDDENFIFETITNKLYESIVSINGITDRNYILDYVKYMNVKDSSSLRKYITSNEPGLDFNVTVEKPKSLGGGSMNTFLSLDQFIFLNVYERV